MLCGQYCFLSIGHEVGWRCACRKLRVAGYAGYAGYAQTIKRQTIKFYFLVVWGFIETALPALPALPKKANTVKVASSGVAPGNLQANAQNGAYQRRQSLPKPCTPPARPEVGGWGHRQQPIAHSASHPLTSPYPPPYPPDGCPEQGVDG